MAVLNFVVAAVFLSSVYADPNLLQRYGAQSGETATTDSVRVGVRSGVISASDATAFETRSSGFESDDTAGSGSTTGSRSVSSGADSSGSFASSGTILDSADSSSESGLPGSIFTNSDSSASASSFASSTGNSDGSLFGRGADVTLSSSQNVGSDLLIDGNLASALGDFTITHETTVDVFKTVTNVIYNSIPITLTEFMKTTVVQPTFKVLSTAVDDHVFVATAPVTRTDSVTVTNINTGYFYVTQVSTDTFTIAHKAYNILQKTLTSTVQQTKVFRPTVVRTRINTEYDTETVELLVSNTVVVQARPTQTLGVNLDSFLQGRPISNQQIFGQRQRIFGTGQQISGSQQNLGTGQQISGSQQNFGTGQQISGSQQNFGTGQQISGSQQNLGTGQQISGGQQNFVRSGSIDGQAHGYY